METKCYCTNCGKEMNAEAEICTSCGVRQGKTIHYCYHCGGEIQENQELCLTCGMNPRKLKKQKMAGQIAKTDGINPTVAAVLGFLLPGIPQLLWMNQKTKGIVLLVGALLTWAFLLGFVIAVLSAIDAYQLSQRVNDGEQLEEWTFFWQK